MPSMRFFCKYLQKKKSNNKGKQRAGAKTSVSNGNKASNDAGDAGDASPVAKEVSTGKEGDQVRLPAPRPLVYRDSYQYTWSFTDS